MNPVLRHIVMPGTILLLAACTSMQLKHMKELQANNQFEEIVAVDSECSSDAETCRQINAIRGSAYLTLAMREAQPDAKCPMPTQTARSNMENAVRAYAFASGAAAKGSEDENNLLANQALALTCTAPFHLPDEAVLMTRQAVANLDALPPSPDHALAASSAILGLAQRTDLPAPARCTAAHDARKRALYGLNGQIPASGETAIRLQQTVSAATAGAPGLPTTCP